jgi:N-methylhydantoinase B/oxoprolinase/acetone carboxylase alpha subunit
MKDIDPVLASVLQCRLKAITEEMGLALLRTTRSPILNEARDFVTGLYGGRAGTGNRIRLFGPDGEVRDALSKEIIRDIRKGTRFTQLAGGGGGLGDPKAREAEKVADEVRDGLLSTAAAGEDYGVAIDPGTGSVDVPATRHLRGEGK